ncbi:alpha/beta-hydrolase [Clavulina sp. PMI_390]|nr:alpha/beta-hydrolase [Clavulina sp. PMI_390]
MEESSGLFGSWAVGGSYSVSLAVALVLLPAAVYTLNVLTRFPEPLNYVKTSPGLRGLPAGELKTRIQQVYPESALGEAVYVSLPFGTSKYSISGPLGGRKIVMLHGLSVPSIILKDLVDHLVLAGYRVLTYDIYGRGYSDSPHEVSLPIYTSQLALIMQHAGWEKARVIGLSMGGAIAAGFAAQFPHLVDGDVALLAPAGNFTSTKPIGRILAFFSNAPFVWLMSRDFVRRLSRPPHVPGNPEQAILQLVALQWKAVPRLPYTLASTLRYGPLRGMGPSFYALEKSSLRVLIMHGLEDVTVPYSPYISPILTDFMPTAKLITIPQAGHDFVFTRPAYVAEELTKFFDGKK